MISNEAEVKCHIRKKELFDLLTKNINFDEIESICLFSLGSPYYAKRIEREHPNIKITIVEDEEMKFLFCDMNNVIYANINKELWPKTMENVNFDCIIMNPPYSGNLHLKILEEAIKHADKTVNLSPVRWLQDPLAEYKKGSDYNKFMGIRQRIIDVNIISKYSAYNLFNVQFTTDLGVYSLSRDAYLNGDEAFAISSPYEDIVNKVMNKAEVFMGHYVDHNISDGIRVRVYPMKPENVHRAHNKAVLFNTRFCAITYPEDYKIYKDGYNVSNGLHWGSDRRKGAGGQKIDESCPLNYSIRFSSVNEAQLFLRSTWTNFMLFYTSIVKTDNNVPLNFLPWMGDVINPITGKKGYESEWTDEAFYKFFNITEEEQKIIEETMEKYK